MSALIEFEQVCKYYQMGDTLVKAADHITMKIEKGEFVAIVGQSGSGKSTCMNIIGCLDVPTYGTYRLNGRDVGKMNRNELAAIRAADMDIKIVLFRNHTLGLVHQIQSSAPYHGPFGVALDGSPDFETIAAAYRVPCIQVGDEDHLDEALDRFLGTQGSCLLICEVHPDVGTND